VNDPSAAVQPTGVVMDSTARRVEIDWADGHQSPYPYSYLRQWCPCASCREQRAQAEQAPKQPLQLRVLPTNVAQTSSDLADVEVVGRYAFQLTWADGHNTGIYSFRMLREMCECDECRVRRPAGWTPV
jgi:DUF971 family protein